MKHMGSYLSRMQPCTLPSAMARHTRSIFAGRRNWMPSFPTVNMNILSRIRGQSSHGDEESGESGDDAERDEEQALEGEESISVAIPSRDDAESWDTISEVYCTGRPGKWLPSMPRGMPSMPSMPSMRAPSMPRSVNLNLLARFRGGEGGSNSREQTDETVTYKGGHVVTTISEQDDDHLS